MAGFTLTQDAQLMCPHGGQVQISAANGTITAGGAVVVQSDVLTISGCPFVLPGGVASPCVQVQWVVPDARVTVAGTPTVSAGSTGLCLAGTGLPQGPVVVTTTQTRAEST